MTILKLPLSITKVAIIAQIAILTILAMAICVINMAILGPEHVSNQSEYPTQGNEGPRWRIPVPDLKDPWVNI